MCALPKGKGLSQKELETCWENNSHGAGFVYLNQEGNFVEFKSMEFPDFRKNFEKEHKTHGKYSPFLVHFRLASHGTKDISNVHPFKVNSNLYMAHNGVLNDVVYKIVDGKPDSRSDTKTFVEDYLATLPQNFINNWATRSLINKFIGSFNKLLFLNKAGEFTIFNESAGVKNDDRWFSNSFFQCERPQKVTYDSSKTGGVISYTGNYGSIKGSSVKHPFCKYCGTKLLIEPNKWYKSEMYCVACDDILMDLKKKLNETEYYTKKIMDEVSYAHFASTYDAKETEDQEERLLAYQLGYGV